MTKKELISSMSEKSGLSKKDVELALSAFISTVTEELQKDESILLSGFGSFSNRTRAPRTGRNPRTNESVQIPATKLPTFKPCQALKDLVGGTSIA